MRKTAPLALLAALLLAPAAASAQTRPYFGVAMGVQRLPEEFDDCDNNVRTVAEGRAGVARGILAVEARVMAAAEVGEAVCNALPLASFAPPPDGVHTSRRFPFDNESGYVGADLRLRMRAPGLPVTVSAGGGYTPTYDLPYALAGVGVRTGGRYRMSVDVEREWYRVESEYVATEWQNSQFIREVSRETRSDWIAGLGVRVGLELSVR
jgi:hypothetical protein